MAPAPTNCASCNKAFNFFTCYRHPCVACGKVFCCDCVNNLIVIKPTDILPPANADNIKDYSKPQKCCASCFERVTNNFQQPSVVEVNSSASNLPMPPSSKSNAASVRTKTNCASDYTMKETLGEGGYGIVKEGIHNATGASYAVKIINRSKLSPEDEAAVLSEARILESISHPNIVKLMDLYIEPVSYYMIMEKVIGGELFDRIIAKTAYSEKEARDLVFLLLSSIKYLHDRNIVHRDLKPENLLMTSKNDDADIKLVDFGFASVVNGFSLTEQCGTPAYVAPEILQGKPYGKPIDMWSFGVILYILLVGYPPFFDNDQQVLFRKIMKGSFEFHISQWRHISFAAKDLISKLLTVDHTKRLTVDDALAHEWLAVSPSILATRNLTTGLVQLKKFQAAKKFKSSIKAVLAANRFQSSITATLTKMNAATATPTAASAANALLAALPHTLDARYQLGKVLGEGGYAVVKLGINKHTKDEVAIKVFNIRRMTANQLKGLKTEVEIMRQVAGHPNIVKFYDFFEENEASYVVMEKIIGGELFDRITRKQHYNEKEARQLARILLHAIKHMHDRNIVHR
jgi:calcium/calmodulin-dependent protein kinase I